MKLEDFGTSLRPPPDEIRVEKWRVDESVEGWYQSLGISKEGCVGQLRRGRLHALDMGDHWLLHRDRVDPAVDPIGHLITDAPAVAVLFGFVSLLALLALAHEQ